MNDTDVNEDRTELTSSLLSTQTLSGHRPVKKKEEKERKKEVKVYFKCDVFNS